MERFKTMQLMAKESLPLRVYKLVIWDALNEDCFMMKKGNMKLVIISIKATSPMERRMEREH